MNWVGNVETRSFNDNEELYHFSDHELTVTVPAGAIPAGKQGVLKVGTTLCAPVKFAPNVVPVSAIVWLCVDVKLRKPIRLCLPHIVKVENRSHVNCLYFAKMKHASTSEGYMNVIDSGEFNVNEAFGLLDVEESSYYCIVNSLAEAEDIPEIRYRIITMKHKYPVDYWKCDICMLPAISTCTKVL